VSIWSNPDPWTSRDMRAVIAGITEAHDNAKTPQAKLGVRMAARRISRSVWPLRSQEPLRCRFWRECFGVGAEREQAVTPS